MEQSEDAFLKALAGRPFDRAFRLVFCDWLLERSDPRGEAMVLFEKGTLSRAERRRLERLQQLNARKWLGPLAEAVVLEKCQFAGGLLRAVTFPVNLSGDRYAALTGEPRLATVESVTIESGRVPSDLGNFLAHPVLSSVVELAGDAATLNTANNWAFSPQVLGVVLWQPERDLSLIATSPRLQGASALRLWTNQFLNPYLAEELADAVIRSGALAGRKSLELVARDATIEGVVQWLRLAALRAHGPMRGKIERWVVEYAETHLGLEGERFEQLTIDAIAPGGKLEVGARIASAASVLALLDGIGIARVNVRHIPGGRLNKDELNTLRSAARRLKTLVDFQVAGIPQLP